MSNVLLQPRSHPSHDNRIDSDKAGAASAHEIRFVSFRKATNRETKIYFDAIKDGSQATEHQSIGYC